MDAFLERLMIRAATIDELLSDAFETLPGQKGDCDLAARRLSAWCQSCASGDWSLFNRRLQRDGLSLAQVLARFATVRRRASAAPPAWIDDANWIEAALRDASREVAPEEACDRVEPYPFEHLFRPVVEKAEALLWADSDQRIYDRLNPSAHACLRQSLLKTLTNDCAPAIYERFAEARTAGAAPASPTNDGELGQDAGISLYHRFVAEMRGGGLRCLFEDKPVLLRLIAIVTRQWIRSSREFVARLGADLAAIERDLLPESVCRRVDRIEGDISDLHNGGRSVQIVRFEGGPRVVYKPKDLRLDAAWHELVGRLNRAGAPVELKAAPAMVRDGYGWTEFIDHTGCVDQDGPKRFFRRAGAWLALFHGFAATDMHQENIIACGDHPTPIDLEMILQPLPQQHKSDDSAAQAFEAATEIIANSIMMVGLLPAYGRSPNNDVFSIGGMKSNWQSRKARFAWHNVNTDVMRPIRLDEHGGAAPNLPCFNNHYAKFGDHVEDFVTGFEDYARFLLQYIKDDEPGSLIDGFAGCPVRKVIRPTRFYAMVAQRLRDHRKMDDGVIWSAQADFLARLADWDQDFDPLWPLQRCERSALLALNVPYFVSPSDGNEIRDATGVSIPTQATSGLDRSRARMEAFDEQGVAWQIEVIRQNTISALSSDGMQAVDDAPRQLPCAKKSIAPANDIFLAEAGRIAQEISSHAIRRGSSAAWIGLDWLGDSEVSQLIPLGLDLYSGVAGIAVFLAAHAACARCESSAELALAAVSQLRKTIRSRNAARVARSLGLGGATGLGSLVYAMTVMWKCLCDDDLRADALAAADLFTDDLIAADQQFDVMAGGAGAILALLRLYRDTQSSEALRRAIACGERLLRQPRLGPAGRRSWVGQGFGGRALNGMSHGAAGFAYALASLAAATGREDFANASAECIAFEASNYDAEQNNWPRLYAEAEPTWPCQWCHGAPGVGLARIAMIKQRAPEIAPSVNPDADILITDIRNALKCVERRWPGPVDTLCCGTLGSVEFFHEAGGVLGRNDLCELAAQRLTAVVENAISTGEYKLSVGKSKFNLGLFRGLAGVGYTLLRRVDRSLPNILIWE
jgi:type 2 lantibiotic biosynthesis protein LanM